MPTSRNAIVRILDHLAQSRARDERSVCVSVLLAIPRRKLVKRFLKKRFCERYNLVVELRQATATDLDLLVRVDLDDEGVSSSYRDMWGTHELAAHRLQIASLIVDGGAHIADVDGIPVGVLLWRPRSLDTVESGSVFRTIDRRVFPANGMFAEIFQLWVDRKHRRRGVGSALKRELEIAARARLIGMIYTHTEERNDHVLAFNLKLGYREVRRGPIWDELVRVSLVKDIG
jgi:ribosomal protein S18 acetylase RimI-like enzyme